MVSSEVLSSLKDIDGVYGSFVVDPTGALSLRDLPGVIDNAALREAGPRIARLWGAFPEDDPPDYVLLEFAAHQVFIKKFELGSLCIFVPRASDRLARLRLPDDRDGQRRSAARLRDRAPHGLGLRA